MSPNKTLLNSRGFSLIEVLVATIILATALVLLTQAMGRSQHVLRIAQNKVIASHLAEDKLTDLEISVRQYHELRFGSERGKHEPPGKLFNWEQRVQTYVQDAGIKDKTKMNLVESRVVWNDGPARKDQMILTSLILNKGKKA